jgi:hypothetical protein
MIALIITIAAMVLAAAALGAILLTRWQTRKGQPL